MHGLELSSSSRERNADEGVHIVSVAWQHVSCNDFILAHFVPSRPLLLRDFALGDPGSWTREQLIERAGDTALEVAPIPYGDYYGCDGTIQSTLRQFLEVEMNQLAPLGHPYYLFSFVHEGMPLILDLIRTELGLPERMPPPFEPFQAGALQFAVG